MSSSRLDEARAASATTSVELSKLTYWDMIKASPKRHKAFLVMIALQILCVIVERVVLFSLLTNKNAEAWYFLAVILVSVGFVGYFAVHSILQCNSFEMGAFFVSSIMLLARTAAEYRCVPARRALQRRDHTLAAACTAKTW